MNLTEWQRETEILGKFVRRINESYRPKVTFEDDDKGKVHKELPSARMLSKMGCKRAKVSEAIQEWFQQKVSAFDRNNWSFLVERGWRGRWWGLVSSSTLKSKHTSLFATKFHKTRIFYKTGVTLSFWDTKCYTYLHLTRWWDWLSGREGLHGLWNASC